MKRRLGLSYKKIKGLSSQVFTRRCDINKSCFIKRMIYMFENDFKIVYIDETGFNNHTFKSKRWAGDAIDYENSKGKRFKNINLLCAIHRNGFHYYEAHQGNTNTNRFMSYFKHLIEEIKDNEALGDKLRQGKLVFYLDNFSVHKAWLFRDYCIEKGHNIIYGVPYICCYNPIEFFFSYLKNSYYKCTFHSRYSSF
jgi:hypothetical protein